jgi:hypothetical protein
MSSLTAFLHALEICEDLNIPIKKSQKITLAAKDNKVTQESATTDIKIAQK